MAYTKIKQEHPTGIWEGRGLDSHWVGALKIVFLSISTWERLSIIYTLHMQSCFGARKKTTRAHEFYLKYEMICLFVIMMSHMLWHISTQHLSTAYRPLWCPPYQAQCTYQVVVHCIYSLYPWKKIKISLSKFGPHSLTKKKTKKIYRNRQRKSSTAQYNAL